jgi:hypothetical protein
MNAKLATPVLGSLDDEMPHALPDPTRPDLKSSSRRKEPRIEDLVKPGFVTEALPLAEATEPTESITIEVPRRLKRALQAEVSARKDDLDRKSVASMKSVILEALASHGYADLIEARDIVVQAGIFMKRQSAQMRKKG